MDNAHCHIDFPWVDRTWLVTSHVHWYLECATFRTRRWSRAFDARTRGAALRTQLLAFPMPICSEDVCQCSIKIPSDKRFKWLPLWVMRSRISEEALTAQHMKTDELDCPLFPAAGAGIVPHSHQGIYCHQPRLLHTSYIKKGIDRNLHLHPFNFCSRQPGEESPASKKDQLVFVLVPQWGNSARHSSKKGQ